MFALHALAIFEPTRFVILLRWIQLETHYPFMERLNHVDIYSTIALNVYMFINNRDSLRQAIHY